MKIRRTLLVLLVAVMLLAIVLVSIAGAATAGTAADFGVLMKPGWGGGYDVPTNTTYILMLRCSFLHSVYASGTPGVFTGALPCARFPSGFMGSGKPLGVYPTTTVTYTGQTNFFFARPY